MEFAELTRTFKERPFFESAELDVLFDEPSNQIRARLSRWASQGKLLQLRRGKYLLPRELWRREPSIYYVSNYLYRPSCVSLESALDFHGLIPEAVGVVQAVTPRHGGRWETEIGEFRYHAIREDRFFGYREYTTGREPDPPRQRRFLMAVPEKALLDVFYFATGEWSEERIAALRLQNLEAIRSERIRGLAERFDSPKVARAAERLRRFLDDNSRGGTL